MGSERVLGQHLFPSAKLKSFSLWLSQGISLSYIKFLCLLKFLFVKSKSLQFLRKKKFRTGRVGFDLGASALQSITFTPTPPRIC